MRTPVLPISAFIISKNEAKRISACLDSLNMLAEIVIVDSGSTDGTLEIIENFRLSGFPIRLFQRGWPGFSAQKQFALDQCTHDWCLSIDCDERLDNALRDALAVLDLKQSEHAGYAIRRVDCLPGYGYSPRWVHSKQHIRLVQRHKAGYDPGLSVHESLNVRGSVGRLEGSLLHDRSTDLHNWIAQLNTYSRLKSEDAVNAGEKSGLLRLIFKPPLQFLKIYIAQRYFLCAVPGLVHAVCQAFYVFATEAKKIQLTHWRKRPAEAQQVSAAISENGSSHPVCPDCSAYRDQPRLEKAEDRVPQSA